MKKRIALALALTLCAGLLAACGNDTVNDAISDAQDNLTDVRDDISSVVSDVLTDDDDSEVDMVASSTTGMYADLEAALDGLEKDQYDDLEMSADVMERKAILPGSAIKVTVNVKNNGDKTLVYTRGSGVFETPEALMLWTDLQPVLPADHLGVATSDYRVEELAPSEQKTFELHVMAIKPDGDFEEKTHTVFASENTYIVDLDWDVLHTMYPELEKAEPGQYKVETFFTYYILEDGEELSVNREPTGYAEADLDISVTD